MAFLDKLTDAASMIGDKAGDAIEITKLKTKITGEKKAIERELAKIGRIYYERQKSGEEALSAEAAEICAIVDAHYDIISETEKMLDLYNDK